MHIAQGPQGSVGERSHRVQRKGNQTAFSHGARIWLSEFDKFAILVFLFIIVELETESETNPNVNLLMRRAGLPEFSLGEMIKMPSEDA